MDISVTNVYSPMTQQEFDDILADLVHENASTLLSVPGAYEVFSEHFNNEVLSRWAQQRGLEDEDED